MSTKTAKDAASGAVSNETEKKDETATGQELATTDQRQDIGAVIGGLGLSQATVERLTLELKEKLHSITIGMDDRTKASAILERGDPFMVIDAVTIEDWENKDTGEIQKKHIFVLEFPQGDVQVIMQSHTRNRGELAETFALARALTGKAVMGPYKMAAKPVAGRPQPALIFERQPGFKARAMSA